MVKRRGIIFICLITLLISVLSAYSMANVSIGNEVVAQVNGTPITLETLNRDVEKHMFRIKQAYGIDYTAPEFEEQVILIKRQRLEQLLRNELLLQVAYDFGIKVTDSEIQAEINEIKSNYPSDEIFALVLANVDYTMDELRQDITLQKAYDQLSAMLVKDDAVTEEDMMDYYQKNLRRYSEEEQIRASHILVDTEEEAKSILQKLSSGANFATLAQNNSTCPSAAQGGDLGFFGRGQMVYEFEEASFSLKVNQLSEPVKTQFGWHIIKLTEKKEAVVYDYQVVKAEIRESLIEKQRYDAAYTYLEKKWAEAKVEYFITF